MEPFRPLTSDNLLISFLWILGLPLLVMAFIMPVVVLNEAYQMKIRRRLTRIAVRLGATAVRKPRIEKVEKPELLMKRRRKKGVPGILESQDVVEIMTSAKGVKTYKRKNDKKKKSPNKKK